MKAVNDLHLIGLFHNYLDPSNIFIHNATQEVKFYRFRFMSRQGDPKSNFEVYQRKLNQWISFVQQRIDEPIKPTPYYDIFNLLSIIYLLTQEGERVQQHLSDILNKNPKRKDIALVIEEADKQKELGKGRVTLLQGWNLLQEFTRGRRIKDPANNLLLCLTAELVDLSLPQKQARVQEQQKF